MCFERVKAHLNLHAVLPNLEDLVRLDPEARQLTRDWQIAIQFVVRQGPKAHVVFKQGACTVGRGLHVPPSVVLFFASPAHLNRMFDGKSNPVPLWGFTKLPFLSRDFAKLTDRLTYFLKPSEALLEDPSYLALNTRLTLNTAAYAVPELLAHRRELRPIAAGLPDGVVQLQVLPDGPSAYVVSADGKTSAGRGEPAQRPMARMAMKDMATANAFLSGKLDSFTAIAAGDVSIRGQLPLLDAMSLVLDHVPKYLS
ncbi:MAG: hypothetical protein JXR83_15695 [Deltaproteobacteria bacterium]|nr:hypothetical protein [Deltaproteobacteria bacterium]